MGEKEHRTILASKLAAGVASDKERDEALAEILLSLWSDKDLTQMIDDRIARCKEQAECGAGSFVKFVRTIVALFMR